MKGGLFGIFYHPFCRKTPKTIEGDPLEKNCFSKENSHNVQNNSRSVLYVTREKSKNLFGLVP